MLTDLNAIRAGAPFPLSDTKRMATYTAVDQLLDDEHYPVFQASFNRLMRDDGTMIEVQLPWPRKLRLIFADLLCGEPPTVECKEASEQEYVDDLVRRLDLWRVTHETCGDTISYGDGLFKLMKRGGKAVLVTQPPDYWYPVVAGGNIRDIVGHILAWRVNIGTADSPKWMGYGEIHEPGYVTNVRFDMDYSGERIKRVVASDRKPSGASGMLVFHAPNWRKSKELCGHSVLEDNSSLLSELEVRISQMSRVFDKHTDPGMYGPEGGLEQDEDGVWHVKGGQFYPVAEGESPPGYVTFNGQLVPQQEYIKFLREELYSGTDTCPALFGKLEQGMAESGSALKRLLIAPLAAVNRLRLTYDSVVRDVLITAAELEGHTLTGIKIGWKDGLPEDPMEAAQVEQTRIASKNTSIRASVARLDGLEGTKLDEELAAIAKDFPKAPAAPAAPPAITLPPKMSAAQGNTV